MSVTASERGEGAETEAVSPDSFPGARTVLTDLFAVGAGRLVLVATAPLSMLFMTAILGASGFGELSLLLIAPALITQLAAQWSSPAPLTLGREEYENHGTLGTTTWARALMVLPLVVLTTIGIIVARVAFGAYSD